MALYFKRKKRAFKKNKKLRAGLDIHGWNLPKVRLTCGSDSGRPQRMGIPGRIQTLPLSNSDSPWQVAGASCRPVMPPALYAVSTMMWTPVSSQEHCLRTVRRLPFRSCYASFLNLNFSKYQTECHSFLYFSPSHPPPPTPTRARALKKPRPRPCPAGQRTARFVIPAGGRAAAAACSPRGRCGRLRAAPASGSSSCRSSL
ncbi:uncharacterized protein LOC114900462 [Monodon monoceros]|uniref:uncharacterized protein LOC114900462 n=1 Tax=Monodon monoceros TaxID=40151 RepID=UPI0010F7E2F3|nr:uncharacterized protein LOC114900462 [Monodon monoceros]